MIVEIVYYGGKKLIEVDCSDVSMDGYLCSYKNIAKNPTVDGFIGYLRDRGVIVESITPCVLGF